MGDTAVSLTMLLVLGIFVWAVVATSRTKGGALLPTPGEREARIGESMARAARLNTRARLLLLRVHQAPDNPTIADLIAAGRYREASEATSPEDHLNRTRLAIVRRGPLPDLMLGATGRPSLRRARARSIIIELTPGAKWPFRSRSHRRANAAVHWLQPALRHRMGLMKLASALRLADRILHCFPQADWRHETAFDKACIATMHGRASIARAAALELAESEASPYYRDQAQRLAHRIGMATRNGGHLVPIPAASLKATIHRMTDRVNISRSQWPLTPQDIQTLWAGHQRTVTDRTLDAESISQNLKAGNEIWVGLMGLAGYPVVRPIAAFEPHTKLILLADGHALDIETAAAHSVWGNRIAILHPPTKAVPGKEPDTSFTQLVSARGDSRDIDTGSSSIENTRAACEYYSDDALASFGYGQVLQALWLETGQDSDLDSYIEHLAVTAARFPGALWPRVVLAGIDGAVVPSMPFALLRVGIESFMPHGYASAAIHPHLTPDGLASAARDYSAAKVTDSHRLTHSLSEAALRGDGVDVDAHLAVLEGIVRNPETLSYLRQLGIVTHHGAAGAIPLVKGTPQDPHGKYVRMILAASSGSRELLERHVSELEDKMSPSDLAEAKVILALHRGDAAAVFEQAAPAIAADGLTHGVGHALQLAQQHLNDDDATDLLRCIEPAIAAVSGPLVSFAWGLSFDTPHSAEQLLLARLEVAPDDLDARLYLARCLANQAAHASGAAKLDLSSRALATLEEGNAHTGRVPMWRVLRAAALRGSDPERALHELLSITDIQIPFAVFVAIAALAEDTGDLALRDRLLDRASNPELINTGLNPILRSGFDDAVGKAVAAVDASLIREAAWLWHAVGGDLPSLPPLPPHGHGLASTENVWRLIAAGNLDYAASLHRRLWTPQRLLEMGDGAPAAAALATIAALQGNAQLLNDALATSRHPSYQRAAAIVASQASRSLT